MGIGFKRTRGGQLPVEIAELLGRERRAVGSNQKIRFGAERLYPRFRVGHLLAHQFDLAGEPLAGGARLLLRRRALPLDVGVRDGVGDARCKFRILRQKVDDNDAGFFHRVDVEAIIIRVKRPLLGRHPHRVFCDAQRAEQSLDQRDAAAGRIEFRQLVQLELGDHLARKVAGKDELYLARYRFLIDRDAIADILVDVGPQKNVVPANDQHTQL